MRFTSLMMALIINFFFSSSICQSIFQIKRLCEKRNEIRTYVLCRRFVAGSLINTCKGYGFTNLEEWKEVCKSLWKLDFIDFDTGEEEVRAFWSKNLRKCEVSYKNEEKRNFEKGL